eukprot:gene22561-29687_t
MQQVAQHKGGAGALGMRPLTEAVQHKGGPGAQGMRPSTEVERSSKQAPNLHTVPHAPESAIPGLPNMFMQMPDSNRGVTLAHTSAVEQGLAGADTFAMCRRSFLTWMAGTPMAQLSKQGTNLEQQNGIERQLLRYRGHAAYCLELLKTLGFSWFSGEHTTIDSKGDAGPPSIREALVVSAPTQPTTSPLGTAHAPATSPTTHVQGHPRSVSAREEVGGSSGLEVGREATSEVSRDAHGGVHPA